MKILSVMGSPHEGDSYRIVRLLEERMNAIEEVEFKYLFVKDIKLPYCKGCCVCMEKGEEYCPEKDITIKIRQEMLNSDAVVFSSPVYAHQVTALMKNFIDHFSYIFHRPCFFGKTAAVVSATGGTGLREVLDYLEMTARGWGFNVAGRLGVTAPAFRYNQDYKARLVEEIDAFSHKFHDDIKEGHCYSPNLSDLLFFRSMKCKIVNVKEYYPCDYQYWKQKGWLDKNYYYDTKISLLKKYYAKLIENRMKNQMSKKYKQRSGR